MERRDLVKGLQALRKFYDRAEQLHDLGIDLNEFIEPVEGCLETLVVKYCPPVGEGSDQAHDALVDWIYDKKDQPADEFLNYLTTIKQSPDE